jgi:hypothetical protein
MSSYDRQMRLPVVQCRRYVHQVPKRLNSNAVRTCSTFQCWLSKQPLQTCQRQTFTVLVHRTTVSFACVHAWRTGYPVQHIVHKSTLIAMRDRDDDCIPLTDTLKNLKRSKSASTIGCAVALPSAASSSAKRSRSSCQPFQKDSNLSRATVLSKAYLRNWRNKRRRRTLMSVQEQESQSVAPWGGLRKTSWMKRRRIHSRKLTSLLDERSALLNGAHSRKLRSSSKPKTGLRAVNFRYRSS